LAFREGGKPFIRSGIIRSGLERGWPFAAKPDTSRARDDRDRGIHELLFAEIGVFWVAKAVNFSRMH
jgi:hypothetical protein